MKNRNNLILLLMSCFIAFNNISLKAQSVKDIFNVDVPITYYGVDFSKGHYFGEIGTVDINEMIDLTNKINELIVKEAPKYNVAAAIQRTEINTKTDLTLTENASIDTKRFIVFSKDEDRLTEDAIKKTVAKYNVSGKGIGMVFMVDLMDKSTTQTTVWVTFFNESNKKLLFTEKLTGKAGGFGFRNYWARSFYNIINDMKTLKFKIWKAKYNK
jgi:hypothetical protein